MNRNTPAFLFATLALLLLHQGCTPEEIDPVAPEIGWISINATEVMSATTPLTVTLYYRDHQGDIGWNDPDVHALQVQDARELGRLHQLCCSCLVLVLARQPQGRFAVLREEGRQVDGGERREHTSCLLNIYIYK